VNDGPDRTVFLDSDCHRVPSPLIDVRRFIARRVLASIRWQDPRCREIRAIPARGTTRPRKSPWAASSRRRPAVLDLTGVH
jgi:hypothetical protein